MTDGDEIETDGTVPMSDWIIEIPFSPADLMRDGRITYGGKPMPSILPKREEWPVVFLVQQGDQVLPGHDQPFNEVAN